MARQSFLNILDYFWPFSLLMVSTPLQCRLSTSKAVFDYIFLKVLPLAELVHLPLVAATDTSITNPKLRFASRNNSVDPPTNLTRNYNNLSRNNSVDPPPANNNNNNLTRNNSVDPPGNFPKSNNLENLPREHNNLPEERRIQMIQRNDGNENQETLENRMTLEALIRTRLLKCGKKKTDSSTKMNPDQSFEFRGYVVGTPTQQG